MGATLGQPGVKADAGRCYGRAIRPTGGAQRGSPAAAAKVNRGGEVRCPCSFDAGAARVISVSYWNDTEG